MAVVFMKRSILKSGHDDNLHGPFIPPINRVLEYNSRVAIPISSLVEKYSMVQPTTQDHVGFLSTLSVP